MRYESVLDSPESATGGRSAVLDAIAVAGLVALAAQVRAPLPWTPVPVTLQTLPVLAVGFAVGWRRATAGMLLFLALGLLGAHVFAVPTGVTFSPTLGYILGFVAAPVVVARFRHPAAGIAAATALIWCLGAAWFVLHTDMSAIQVLALAVAPFIPGDLLKAYAAYRIGLWVRR